jgi:hypothetical protein
VQREPVDLARRDRPDQRMVGQRVRVCHRPLKRLRPRPMRPAMKSLKLSSDM